MRSTRRLGSSRVSSPTAELEQLRWENRQLRATLSSRAPPRQRRGGHPPCPECFDLTDHPSDGSSTDGSLSSSVEWGTKLSGVPPTIDEATAPTGSAAGVEPTLEGPPRKIDPTASKAWMVK